MSRVNLILGPKRKESRASGERAAKIASAAWVQAESCSFPRGCWAAPRPIERKTEKLREFNALGQHTRMSPAPDRSAGSSATAFSELDRRYNDFDLWHTFAEDPGTLLPPYLTLRDSFLKEEMLTKDEMKFKDKALLVEVTKLNNKIKQAQVQQEQLQENNRHLCIEKVLVQAEDKFILEYLANKTEEYKKQPNKLWNNYVQKSEELELWRQEIASRYAKKASVLKAELLQKEKTQALLKQQLKALQDILLLKEKQEIEIQTLQKEKRKIQDETATKARKAQGQLLQEKALLEKQLNEPDMSQWGNTETRELQKNSQTLELAAKQYTLEFYRGINTESRQVQKDLQQLIQQSQDLVACQSQLINQKLQLQQELWYLDGVFRGRQRMQRRFGWCLKDQLAPKITLNPPPGTKSRITQRNTD